MKSLGYGEILELCGYSFLASIEHWRMERRGRERVLDMQMVEHFSMDAPKRAKKWQRLVHKALNHAHSFDSRQLSEDCSKMLSMESIGQDFVHSSGLSARLCSYELRVPIDGGFDSYKFIAAHIDDLGQYKLAIAMNDKP